MALDAKQAVVIAWLAVHGQTSRARLATLLWPNATAERARGNLRQRLSTLRQSCREVISDANGLLALGAGTAVDPAPLGSHWLEAFEYDGCDELSAWLEASRDAQRGQRRRAMLASVRASVQDGALDQALRHADELLEVDRESEEAYRALMEVYYLRGDQAAAIAVWDQCREMLRKLYGVAPSAATQRLGQSILASKVDLEPQPPAVAMPVTLLRPPRLVGRAGMIASLVAAWQAGATLSICGEAGVGKSRLLGEFAAALGPCAFGAARPGDAAVPYASLSRLVLAAIERFDPPLTDDATDWAVRLLPQIATACGRADPEPLRTSHQRNMALAGIAGILSACVDRGCKAFVFDDLQFADRASVEALQSLVERGAQPPAPWPARLALGSRDDELTPVGQALLASLDSARALRTLKLSPLTDSEVLELLQTLDLPGFDPILWAPRLRRRVGGNPAFLLESIKLVAVLGQLGEMHQELPIPPGIEAVVERRVAMLSPVARHIAELASIASDDFDMDLASRALARPLHDLAEPMRELELRQVLYGRQFVHDIVASEVRRNVSSALAERLHRFVAEDLTVHGGELAVIAGHWKSCGDWRRAGESYMAAAARARSAVRPDELASMLDAAADAFGRCGAQALRFDALDERLQVSSAPDFLSTRGTQLTRLQGEAKGEQQSLRALLLAVSADADHLRSDTLAMAEHGLARARALGLEKLEFEFSQAISWQLAGKGEPERAMAVIEAQRPWIFAQSDPALHVRFHIACSVTLAHADRLADAIGQTEKGLALLRGGEDPLPMLPLLANLGLMRSWRGEFEAARQVLVEAVALRDRLHSRGTGLLIDVHLGAALRDLGRYREAQSVLESALAEYRTELAVDGELTDLILAENHLAQLWLVLGRADLAEAAFAADASSTEIRFRMRRSTLRLRASRVARGHDAKRFAELQALIKSAPASPHRIMAELELSRNMSAEDALVSLAQLETNPMLAERPGLLMHVLALVAQAAHRHGDDRHARLVVNRLLQLEMSFAPFDVDPIEVWSAMHAVLLKAGDEHRAKEVSIRSSAWRQSMLELGLPENATPH